MAQPKRYYQPPKTTTATSTTAATKPVAGTNATTKKAVTVRQPLSSLFTKDNYLWMGIGAVIILLGMLLMMGGKNESPNVFDYNVVYSTVHITIAPILILAGLMTEVYAIFKNPKREAVTTTTE